jgi:hypothetical protein
MVTTERGQSVVSQAAEPFEISGASAVSELAQRVLSRVLSPQFGQVVGNVRSMCWSFEIVERQLHGGAPPIVVKQLRKGIRP